MPVVVIVFVALILKVHSTPTCTRNQYKKIYTSGDYICDDCPKCPAGYGLLVQCGTNIPVNTRIKCQQCFNQANYSSEYDYEQCQSCGGCSKDQVMTSCTIESNTICHHECISKENYYEQSSDDCQECSWCCGDGNDIVQKECVKKGMPQQKSCTVHRRKECTPVVIATTTPTIKPNTVANSTTPTTPTQSTIGVDISSRLNATITIPVDGESKKKETNQSHNSNLTINIIFGCFVGILIVIAVIYFVIKRRINYNQGRLQMWVHFDNNYPIPQADNELANNDALTEENSSVTQPLMVDLPAEPTSSSSPAGPLSSMSPEENSSVMQPLMVDLPATEQTSASPAESMQSSTSSPAGASSSSSPAGPSSSSSPAGPSSSSSPAGPSSSTSPAPSQNAVNNQTIGTDVKLFELFDNDDKLKEKVCDMLDYKDSFADVARYFKMEEHRINKMKHRPGDNPTADVLEFVKCSCDPNLTVSEFLSCTNKIERKDVSKALTDAL